MTRLRRLMALLEASECDAYIISDPLNIRYLSGFTGTSAQLFISSEDQLLITDSRYEQQARQEVIGFHILINQCQDITSVIKQHVDLSKNKIIGIENMVLTVDEYDWLKVQLPEINFFYMDNIVTSLREIKDQDEINKLRKAADLTDKAFVHIVNWLKSGVSEKELALELELFMRRNGAEAVSFPIIVASGLRGCLPHGRASDKCIQDGELITIDFGCVYKGYTSDMTRTIVMGNASEEQKKIHQIVWKSKRLALEAIKAEVECAHIDSIAREYIEKEGYGKYFKHNLGHALGLSVHEFPRLAKTSYSVLKVGMVLTVEPGIYIPDFGGVRLEDMLLVTKDGYELLTKSSQDLIEVG